MIKLIVGSRGAGKTKQMVEMINKSVQTANGNVVCIERGMQLTYDLDHRCRLIDMEEYHVEGGEMLYGFIAGILAGNYDIEEIYIDGILKIINRDMDILAQLLEKLLPLCQAGGCKFWVTVSESEDKLPETVKKYL